MKLIQKISLLVALVTCGSMYLTACKDGASSSTDTSSSVESSSVSSVPDSESSISDSSSENPVSSDSSVSSEDFSSSDDLVSSEVSSDEASSDSSDDSVSSEVSDSSEISSEDSSSDVSSDSSESSESSDSSDASDSSDSSDSSSSPDGYIAPPAEETTITFQTPTSGKGTEYNRYECSEGYYECTISARGFTYYSFSISQPGQYALYTIEPVENVQIMRYDASVAALNESSAHEAITLDDGKLYSLVNCSDKMFDYKEDIQGSHWRATYGIKSLSGKQTVKIRFVRVADPINEPETIYTKITPNEIKGVATVPTGCMPTAVPYDSNYFYDPDYEMTFNVPIGGETTGTVTAKGFYRLCERDEQGNITKKGDVIYVAIEKGSRLMDVSFAEAQDKGNALSVFIKTDETTGNYIVHNYISFITNDDGGDTTEDLTKVCYMNVCNKDGLFPVNQELFTFLNAYVKIHPPILGEDETVADENLWLSACSYYKTAREGSMAYPKEIPTSGFSTTVTSIDYEVDINEAYTYIYHCIKWHGFDDKSSGYYTITSNDDNAWLTIDNQNYSGKFSVTFEVDKTTGKTFAFSYGTTLETAGTTGKYTITISEAQGVYKAPYTLTSLSDVTLSTNEVIDANGDKVYFAVYTYTQAGNDSVLSISTEMDGVEFSILAGADDYYQVFANSDGNLSFTFLVSSKTPLDEIPVSITLTPIPIDSTH